MSDKVNRIDCEEGVHIHDALKLDASNLNFKDLLKPCPDMTYFDDCELSLDNLGERGPSDFYTFIGAIASLVSPNACMTRHQYKQLVIALRQYFERSDVFKPGSENYLNILEKTDIEMKIATWINSCRLQCDNCLNNQCGHRVESETQE